MKPMITHFRHLRSAFAVVVLVAVCTSCATLFTGTTDNVYIQSQPEGAQIFIEGLEMGTTPATIPIKRPGLSDKQVTLRLDGYEDRVFLLQSEFNVVSILNLFGLLGWVIDIATGAIKKYDPKNYDIELDSKRQSLNLDMNNLERDHEGRYLIPKTNTDQLILRDERNNNLLVLTR